LREFANISRGFGYRRLIMLFRQPGEPSGVNRNYRLYQKEGLSVRKRRTRYRAVGTRVPILVEARLKATGRWILFMTSSPMVAASERRHRRYQGMSGGDPGTSIPGWGRARTDGVERSPWQARHDCLGQWHRVHLQRHAELVGGQPDRLALHCGKPDAERISATESERLNHRYRFLQPTQLAR
jgi:hypothetical protein